MPPQESAPEFKLSEIEQKAYELLAKKRNRIDLDTFADLYDKAGIEANKREVEKLEKGYGAHNTETQIELKKLSELFEVMFSQLVELEDWFGDDVFIAETSKFDDYVNGIDAIVEFLREGSFSHLGLAIDVTFTKDTGNKIKKIVREIQGNRLPKVKYFVSEGGDFRGELSNIPHIVLGTDRKTLDQLAELILDLNYLKKRKETQASPQLTQQIKEVRAKLQNHPLQIELLAQIELQLERFGEYAARIGKMDIAVKYQSVLSIVRKIRDAKKDIEHSPETETREMRMFNDIEKSLNQNLPSTVSTE
jgi:hypothetical protein